MERASSLFRGKRVPSRRALRIAALGLLCTNGSLSALSVASLIAARAEATAQTSWQNAASPAPVERTDPTTLSAQQVGEILAAASQADCSTNMSPDGRAVTYAVRSRNLGSNTEFLSHYLQWLPERLNRPFGAKVNLPSDLIPGSLAWCPDGKCLSFRLERPGQASPLYRYDIASAHMTPIALSGDADAIDRDGGAGPLLIGNAYRWSPDGAFIAFTGLVEPTPGLDARKGTLQNGLQQPEHLGLFVLDVATGRVRQLTPRSVWVIGGASQMSWSPDSTQLAFTTTNRFAEGRFDSDIAIVSRTGGAVRSLVSRPGGDSEPSWSPDGKLIAFSTVDGDPQYRAGWLGIVPSSGGATISFRSFGWRLRGQRWWNADGKTLYMPVLSAFTTRAAYADPLTGAAGFLASPRASSPLANDDCRSVDAGRLRMALRRDSVSSPGEIIVQNLTATGQPRGEGRKITDLAASFPLTRLVESRTVTWWTFDRSTELHGTLVLPKLQPGSRRPTLPTIVYFNGGPGATTREFGDAEGGAILSLAARGYAVFWPNTRAHGGNGIESDLAIRRTGSRLELPLEDALAGVDELVAQGIADPARLGVMGHSYGAELTNFAVTATRRFKAAISHEGPSFFMSMTIGGLGTSPDSASNYLLHRDHAGIENPYDPAEQAKILGQVPLLNAAKVKTPVMIMCGSRSPFFGTLGGDCTSWYNALRHFGVPSVYFLYDEGHVYRRPAAIADNLTRIGEWFDYWLRGMAYPDPTRAKEFDSWRAPVPRPAWVPDRR